MIGKVARCRANRIGIILDEKGGVFFGMFLNGKQGWTSMHPTVLADSIGEYILKNTNSPDTLKTFVEEVDQQTHYRSPRRKKTDD